MKKLHLISLMLLLCSTIFNVIGAPDKPGGGGPPGGGEPAPPPSTPDV